MRNPVLGAAVVSSILLAGFVGWHTRGGSPDAGPVINLGPSAGSAPRRISLVEHGTSRRFTPPDAAVTADALWIAAEQIQRELHAATTRSERERLLSEFETIVQQMNALQAGSAETL